MRVPTTRFGVLHIDAEDTIHFPGGMLGLKDCRHWVLLADGSNPMLGWLQSTTHAGVALAVVSPRRFVPDYQVRVPSSELAPLGLSDRHEAEVLAIVSRNEMGMTLNLKAPLVINVERRLGRQVVCNGDLPLQFPLAPAVTAPLRKSA